MKRVVDRESFPNMLSLVRYEIWRTGECKIARTNGGIPTAKARAAARELMKQKAVICKKKGSLLIFCARPGTILDRSAYPEPPEDVESWV